MLTQMTPVPAANAAGFDILNLITPLSRALQDEQYTTPTPIQLQAIPPLLEGRDLLGCAQTGTGKTAAFALPILQHLSRRTQKPGPKEIRTLILTPTRELASQIGESFKAYGRYLKFKQSVVFGGVKPHKQIQSVARGADVLIATPGRLLDLYRQGCMRLDKIEVFVLDEADQMLDMGFLPDVKKVFNAIPNNRQTVLFSATMPGEIAQLTHTFLNNPVTIRVNPPASTVEKIDQRILFVERENKNGLLESILGDPAIERALVFTRTKHVANRVAKTLSKIRIRTEALHSDKSQSTRSRVLNQFRTGQVRVLVATDIASRGLDVDGITHVINYELPREGESYVHRIGRTARAGAEGIAISFCDSGERPFLRRIEKTINMMVRVDADHPFHSHTAAANGRSFTEKLNGKGGNGNNAKRSGSNFAKTGKRSPKGKRTSASSRPTGKNAFSRNRAPRSR